MADSPPVFPGNRQVAGRGYDNRNRLVTEDTAGLSLRDLYAIGFAMVFAARGDSAADAARLSHDYSDAMLMERSK